MKRIVAHWTGGGHKANATDKKHYHFIVEGGGRVVPGNHPVSANKGPLSPRQYAAHTRGLNTGSIGISMACMAGAVENKTNGRYPMTEKQFEAMCEKISQLSIQYNIPVNRRTVLSHAEVQDTLGVKQRNKWDFNILPFNGMRGAKRCGDYMRSRVRSHIAGQASQQKKQPDGPALDYAVSNEPRPKTLSQSTTIPTATGVGVGGAITTGIGALASIDDRVVALALIGVGVLVMAGAAYIFRERLKKLARGI